MKKQFYCFSLLLVFALFLSSCSKQPGSSFREDVSNVQEKNLTVLSQTESEAAAINERFSDIENYIWYSDYVQFAKTHSFVYGTTPSTFEPESDMTQFQAITVLGRIHESMTGEKVPEDSDSGFWDWLLSPFRKYYTPYVNWAKNVGLLDGDYEIPHRVERAITREELVVLLYRYVSMLNVNENRKLPSVCFYDPEEATPSAEAALREMEKYRIFHTSSYFSGYDGNSLKEPTNPLQEPVSRGECIGILVRLYQRLTYPLDDKTMRIRYYQCDPYERHYWPGQEEEKLPVFLTNMEEYEAFTDQITPLAFSEDEGKLRYGKPYLVNEATFENHNILAVTIDEYSEGEISCECIENTVTVTFVSDYTWTYDPAKVGRWGPYLYLIEVPKNITQSERDWYWWLSDTYPPSD